MKTKPPLRPPVAGWWVVEMAGESGKSAELGFVLGQMWVLPSECTQLACGILPVNEHLLAPTMCLKRYWWFKGNMQHSVYWKRQDRSRTDGQSRPPERCAGQISSHTPGILEDSVPGLSFLLGC